MALVGKAKNERVNILGLWKSNSSLLCPPNRAQNYIPQEIQCSNILKVIHDVSCQSRHIMSTLPQAYKYIQQSIHTHNYVQQSIYIFKISIRYISS
jgi:hypothetical protein